MEKVIGVEGQTMERMNTSIDGRKPTWLASILVDILKENGWSADDIHFLGVEIINESGML